MLYIISGSSRSGKTILAKTIHKEEGINYLSLDWLVMGFTNGIPELGIHDKLFPDEIAEKSWGFIKAMIESMIYVNADCIIEGEAILPELIVELRDKYPDRIKVCFIGYSKVSVDQKIKDIKKYSTGKSDWLVNNTDEYILDHTINMIIHSKEMKKSCAENNIAYFDTSEDFIKSLELARQYLFTE